MTSPKPMPAGFRRADADGLTKDQLAEMFGVSPRTIGVWRGKTRPIPPGPEYRTSGRVHRSYW